jgi:hypothetical protein
VGDLKYKEGSLKLNLLEQQRGWVAAMATRKETDASRAAALSAAFARASLRLRRVRTPTATPNPSFIVSSEKNTEIIGGPFCPSLPPCV